MKAPKLQYAPTERGHIAFQTIGEGPVDMILSVVWAGSIRLLWDEPAAAAGLRRLAQHGRLILFDPLGFGASDREDPTIEFGDALALDEIAVLDHLGVQGAHAIAWTAMARVQARVVRRRPDLIGQCVLVQPSFGLVDPATPDLIDSALWGGDDPAIVMFGESALGDEAWLSWYRRSGEQTGPRTADRLWRWLFGIDESSLIDDLTCPVEVINGNRDNEARRARYGSYATDASQIAAHFGTIPRTVDSSDALAFTPDFPKFTDAIAAVLDPDRALLTVDRTVLTVCFTDIVASTERARELGDDAWRLRLDRHDSLCRDLVERYGGRLVKSTGDGHLSVFASPTAAIEAASELLDALASADIPSRGGIHIGEVEVRGDDVGGIAVHLASRVCSQARDGELWVSDTIRHVTLGGQLLLEPKGTFELKGIDGTWALHRVLPAAAGGAPPN